MKINETNYIQQLRLRNEKALEYVIDQYGWLIQSVIKKHLFLLESYQDDCINDTLLGIWNNIESFDQNKSTFKNWIAGIARYKSIDYKRKYLKDLQNTALEDTELVYQEPGLEDMIRDELSQELEAMLNCLKKEDQDIFKMLFIEEKDIALVSQETGLKPSNIYNRVSRGKSKIKTLFSVSGRG